MSMKSAGVSVEVEEETETADGSQTSQQQLHARQEQANQETNFFKFLKKDFEDLSLGPIKKPKTHRKRIAGQIGSDYAESREDSEEGSVCDPAIPEVSNRATESSSKMEKKEEGSQEDAAAAWRAQRAQKSCLHSGKVGEGGSKTEVKEWTTFETTWRVGTLPFRLARNSILSGWRAKTKPTWSSELDQAVTSLRTYIENTPLNMSMVRMILDRALPASSIPEGVTHVPHDLGGGLKVTWHFPQTLRHQAEAGRFILYIHGPNSSPSSVAHRGLVSRLVLECDAAVVTVDYRRTPENTREESLADLSKAYKWLATQPGVMPAQLLVMADGLGGALAVTLVCEVRDAAEGGEDDITPAACAFISPWVDLEAPNDESWEKSGSVDYVSKRLLAFLAQSYAGLLPLNDAAASPTHAKLHRFPPTLLSVGQCEALYQQGVEFGAKLREAGVTVQMDEADEQVHAFQLLAPCHAACAAGVFRLGAFARRMSPGHLKFSTEQVDALIAQAATAEQFTLTSPGPASADVFKPPEGEPQ
mmetsp:Transcript_3267/g.6680  ORF Transcript_3267/g.6680 Transcript_3267/m.6680 type:complete len:531 (-) Transcript_3267:53-1645(-)|eukprot:CAMPEP_0181297558 /NCGR_PEP_ID=MMETSP1101-20121128/5304_1 /TAXON_ID=46948 /ORGANISM="Rhodomonas abbreviata, Strain Caron Lab Isolate" /LENGTH=530 /DNA_ID=CAMNT_0023402503 /DNA_START=159 /DNA_END=1751 /DNA_ORIENTATION=+